MANNEYLIQDTTIQEIVDKVKLKTGTTGGILGSEIANKIDSILNEISDKLNKLGYPIYVYE